MRRCRHENKCFISGAQREGCIRTSDAIERGSYPPELQFWHSFEIPWGLFAKTPQVAVFSGLDLADSPYKAEETP